MKSKYIPTTLLTLIVLALYPALVHAQNEVQLELSSLRGIGEMGFSINMEASEALSKREELDILSIRKQVVERLKDEGIPVVSETEARSSADMPLLHMHINTMDAGRGLVPFAISIHFYQPVRLVLNRDMQTTASTWETGMVGIVSLDQLGIIGESAVQSLDAFISDYRDVNL